MFQRLINWFTTGLEQTLQVAKAVSLLATIVGAYYFVAYLGALGVPFPADFSVLPSVLLAVGVVTVGITAIVFVYILLAGWIQTDPLNMGYAELIHTRPSGLIGHGGRTAAATVVAIYVIPYLAWVVVLYQAPENQVEIYLTALLLAFGAWACMFAFAKVKDTKEQDRRKKAVLFSKISASVFLLSFITIISSLVYVVLLQSRGLMKTWDQIALSLAAFAAINVGILYPALNVNEFNKANKEALEGKKLDASSLTKRIYKTPVLLAVGFLVLISLFPPFSAYVGELPTKLLGLSSNEPRVIYSDANTAKAWPSSLRAACSADSCRSVPVTVALDLGKYLYVRSKDGKELYRLERTNIVEQFMGRDGKDKTQHIASDSNAQQGAAADAENRAAEH